MASEAAIHAFDLGTGTDWAMLKAGCPAAIGKPNFEPCRFEGDGMRYLRFHGWPPFVDWDAIRPTKKNPMKCRCLGWDCEHWHARSRSN